MSYQVTKRFTVSHGSKKYDVFLESGQPTLKDLSLAVEHQTGVPLIKQKLICRGKTLSDMTATLDSLKVSEKSKIMLIGKKIDAAEENNIKKLIAFQKDADIFWNNYLEIKTNIEGLSQGFLDKDQCLEASKKLKKQIVGVGESLMKTIESMDCMEIDASHAEARAKRKALISEINKRLNSTDKTEDELDNFVAKL